MFINNVGMYHQCHLNNHSYIYQHSFSSKSLWRKGKWMLSESPFPIYSQLILSGIYSHVSSGWVPDQMVGFWWPKRRHLGANGYQNISQVIFLGVVHGHQNRLHFLQFFILVVVPIFLFLFCHLIFPGNLKGAADEAIKKFEKENVTEKNAEKVTKTTNLLLSKSSLSLKRWRLRNQLLKKSLKIQICTREQCIR